MVEIIEAGTMMTTGETERASTRSRNISSENGLDEIVPRTSATFIVRLFIISFFSVSVCTAHPFPERRPPDWLCTADCGFSSLRSQRKNVREETRI